MPDLLLTPRFWPCGAAVLVGFSCAKQSTSSESLLLLKRGGLLKPQKLMAYFMEPDI